MTKKKKNQYVEASSLLEPKDLLELQVWPTHCFQALAQPCSVILAGGLWWMQIAEKLLGRYGTLLVLSPYTFCHCLALFFLQFSLGPWVKRHFF